MNFSGLFSIVLWIAVVRETATIDASKFISETDEDCKVTNELYWKMIQWYYGPLKFVDVYILTESVTTLSMNQLATLFLRQIAESKLNNFI